MIAAARRSARERYCSIVSTTTSDRVSQGVGPLPCFIAFGNERVESGYGVRGCAVDTSGFDELSNGGGVGYWRHGVSSGSTSGTGDSQNSDPHWQ